MKNILVSCLAVTTVMAFCSACKSSSKPAAPRPAAAAAAPARPVSQAPSAGSIERIDPALDKLIAPGAVIERLAAGFGWAEGPLWYDDSLLFSDIPANTVFRWKPGGRATPYIRPSGYTGALKRGGEAGSNGLARDRQGNLVLCQHGDRCLARLEKDGNFTVFAAYYKMRRFNSPNDLVFKRNGDVYFTDPPYGLEKGNADLKKELPFNGVFRVKPSGEATLLVNDLTFPNGLAFSPDEKTLYIAVSDPVAPRIMAYEVQPDGLLGRSRVFFDAAPLAKTRAGLPDGLKVDRAGNVFATGPGGVLVISPAGRHLGTILTGDATANCAWGGNGSVLYITANHDLLRIQTITRGAVSHGGGSVFPGLGKK